MAMPPSTGTLIGRGLEKITHLARATRYLAADLHAAFLAKWESKYRHINGSFAAWGGGTRGPLRPRLDDRIFGPVHRRNEPHGRRPICSDITQRVSGSGPRSPSSPAKRWVELGALGIDLRVSRRTV